MKDVIYLLFDLLTILTKLLGPGGSRAVIAENLLLKQQLIIHSRSRQRAPNLTTRDRALLGFWSLLLNPRRIARAAVIITSSILIRFHNALKKRKYRNLYSPRGGRKPGPKGPSKQVIPDKAGQALNAIVDGPTVCRMFNDATSEQGWPKYLSSDNDPLFQYHRWKDNLRVQEIEETKSLPHMPMSHPFVERLIDSIRRELMDQTLFWTATDLENTLRDYQCYYNKHRAHSGRDGTTPVKPVQMNVVNINQYRWQKHCRGIFELPIGA